MSRRKPNDLGRAIGRFFEEYLPHLRGLSTHTDQELSRRPRAIPALRLGGRPASRRTARHRRSRPRTRDAIPPTPSRRCGAMASRPATPVWPRSIPLRASSPQNAPSTWRCYRRCSGFPLSAAAREAPIEYFETQEMAALNAKHQSHCARRPTRLRFVRAALQYRRARPGDS